LVCVAKESALANGRNETVTGTIPARECFQERNRERQCETAVRKSHRRDGNVSLGDLGDRKVAVVAELFEHPGAIGIVQPRELGVDDPHLDDGRRLLVLENKHGEKILILGEELIDQQLPLPLVRKLLERHGAEQPHFLREKLEELPHLYG